MQNPDFPGPAGAHSQFGNKIPANLGCDPEGKPSQSMKKILIYGSKSFGNTIRHLAAHCGYSFHGYIDDLNPQGSDVVGDFEQVKKSFSSEEYAVAVAIGYRYLKQRSELLSRVWNASYRTPSLIHPSAYVDPSAEIGEGSFIMSNCTIDINVSIGRGVVIWPGAVVCHDSKVCDNVFISPNATLCGKTTVGKESFIGATASIVDHNTVPDGSFVKAGAVYFRKSIS